MSKKRFELLNEAQRELVGHLLPEPKRRRDKRGRPWASNRVCLARRLANAAGCARRRRAAEVGGDVAGRQLRSGEKGALPRLPLDYTAEVFMKHALTMTLTTTAI